MKPIKRIVACIIASMCLIAMFGCEPAQKGMFTKIRIKSL